jgi:virginiamycin B lyase
MGAFLPLGAYAAASATGTIATYSTPTPGSGPAKITVGPDGALWFTENNAGYIGRLDPSTGAITEYPIPSPGTQPVGIVAADGKLWFAENQGDDIGSVDPSLVIPGKSTGIEQYKVPTAGSDPQNITALDGQIWFTEQVADKIGRLDPSKVVPGTSDGIFEYPIPTPGSEPNGITVGPGVGTGAGTWVWFTEYGAGKIGAINPTAAVPGTSDGISEYLLRGEFGAVGGGIGARNIAESTDGRIWFTEYGDGGIGVLNPRQARAGTSEGITEYPLPNASQDQNPGPRGIVGGPADIVWFTEYNANVVATVGPSGTFGGPYSAGLPADGGARSIDVGPVGDDRMWVTEYNTNVIASVGIGTTITATPTPAVATVSSGQPSPANSAHGGFPLLIVLVVVVVLLAGGGATAIGIRRRRPAAQV